ncbi:MAG: DUF3604 domain-containing protein [Deltaproteobacteria bacterium]|nr:DUF3604 domain-containing protein [Deltaproteobacteria bacterium]
MRRIRFVEHILFVLSGFVLLTACQGLEQRSGESGSHSGAVEELAAELRNPLKDAYFGDLHIHSSWSLDAFAFGVRVGPEDAYRYARGGEIDHISGNPIQMQGPPLDFVALTEHANYMGIPTAAQDSRSPIRELPLIQGLLATDAAVKEAALARLFQSISSDTFIPELANDAVVESTWRQIIDLADRHSVPGEFTAFVAYEYTSMPEGQNLHRNVIFRGSNVPARPFSTFDSQNPEDLWDWMEQARATGSDVIAIPHNANGSNGLMYQRVDQSGRPIDARYAAIRVRNEPVSEVIQIKGQSETHPELSPNDEWARFSVLDTILGRPADKSQLEGSYARLALMNGLEMEEEGGFNPYLFGMIGSSDGHNASSPVEESNYTGKIGVVDGTPAARIIPPAAASDLDIGDLSSGSPFGAAGLAGVWAEANTRADLFDALRAREVFATSGPRIRVRLFGGWQLSQADLETGMVQAGYARGVPMGGEDPLEAPLERMQIVKAWIQDGKARERVYDVACADGRAPDAKSHRCGLEIETPDLSDCSYDASKGSPELSAAWSDPDFDVQQRAFYYARVIQIPTCRWSTFDALRLRVPRPPGAPAWLQERAVTSPIWYRPQPLRS